MIKEVFQEGTNLIVDISIYSILFVIMGVVIYFDAKIFQKTRSKKYIRKRIVNWVILCFIKGSQYMTLISINFLGYTYKGRRYISFSEVEFDILIIILFISIGFFSLFFSPILNYFKMRRILSFICSIQCLSSFIFGTIILKNQKSTIAHYSVYIFYLITSISYVINELILIKILSIWYTTRRERSVIVSIIIIGEVFKSSFGWTLNQYQFSSYLGVTSLIFTCSLILLVSTLLSFFIQIKPKNKDTIIKNDINYKIDQEEEEENNYDEENQHLISTNVYETINHSNNDKNEHHEHHSNDSNSHHDNDHHHSDDSNLDKSIEIEKLYSKKFENLNFLDILKCKEIYFFSLISFLNGFFGDSFFFWFYHTIFNVQYNHRIEDPLHIFAYLTSNLSIGISTILFLILFYFFFKNILEIGFILSFLIFLSTIILICLPHLIWGFWLKFLFLGILKIFLFGLNSIIRFYSIEIGGIKYCIYIIGIFRFLFYLGESFMLLIFNESFKIDQKTYLFWRISIGFISFFIFFVFSFLFLSKKIEKRIKNL